MILFDGVCSFCNGTVNFIIRNDKKGILKFAPLQSDAGKELLKKYNLPDQPESFILIENNKVYKKTTAGMRMARHFKWYWQWMQVFRIVPAFIRDAVYNLIAKNRYKWFGKKDQCMVPTPEIKKRFLS